MSEPTSSQLPKEQQDGYVKPTKDKPSAFFGRRKGKPLSPNQQKLMDELLPKLLLDPSQPITEAAGLFSHSPKAIWLEIGFGGAEHMVHQAQENPQIGMIGCEPFINGISKAVDQIAADEIETIRLYNEDAAHILDWLPEASIDRLFLLYPDPWHKKRHWKRRFVSDHNLGRILRVLKPGGHFRFASDIESYVEWTLEHVAKQPLFKELGASDEERAQPYPDWRRTRYEAKAFREGRTPKYLTFERLAGKIEP